MKLPITVGAFSVNIRATTQWREAACKVWRAVVERSLLRSDNCRSGALPAACFPDPRNDIRILSAWVFTAIQGLGPT